MLHTRHFVCTSLPLVEPVLTAATQHGVRRLELTQLEFALIPIAIVMGYGVTLIIRAWTEIIHRWHERECTPYLYLSATGMSLVFMYMNFAGLWAYQNVEFAYTDSVFSIGHLFALSLPMILIMLSVSVLVRSSVVSSSNLDAVYFALAKRYFSIQAVAVVASFLPDLMPGVTDVPYPLPGLIMICVYLYLAFSQSRAIHCLAHILFWLMIVLVFGVFREEIQISGS